MTYEDKFRIPKPTKEQIATLEKLVDEIKNLTHHDSALANKKLQELNNQLITPIELIEIEDFYSSEKLLESHLIPYPSQYRNLSDDELLWLIAKIQENMKDFSNVKDPFITNYYLQIVDFNTSSPSGSTKALITRYYERILYINTKAKIVPDIEPEAILSRLKENRGKVILL